MRFNIDKVTTFLFIFLLGFINLGMVMSISYLLIYPGQIISHLLDYAIAILIIVFVNFIVLTAFCEKE